ncbi:C40 family peptidase [Aestuariicoccus sp. MJ-SS9]|uniref:C40 family peptidase n=1 Tax=Aestuariicoccus sp. MJ-SS9 TaxID=3079855 RepID=UPI00290912E4|nr:NlpC/P60 family protein [Aestuariicoccus sp. MJ-SS9]MDU8910105.1 NlpC/P60 family protein [Aestuariicoccus sp. MJ-SS9]
MTDRRLTPANGRVAAAHLRGQVQADRFVEGAAARVAVPVATLRRAPDGARDRELLLGAAVTTYEDRDGWAFVQAAADGYVGYLHASELSASQPLPTHRVTARATHAYALPDLKSEDRMALPMGAQLRVRAQNDRFADTDLGHIPASHLSPLDTPAADPVAVAERLIGTPYLWGGNSCWGIDCSGLVQIAFHLCNRACPGDSDLQEAALGETLPAGTPPLRGDLMFWKGHVAWVSGPDTLLHANAHHMSVTFEPLADAIARIAAQGDGPVTRHARLT